MDRYKLLFDCFPFKNFRKDQDHYLKKILDAFDSGKEFVILEAPTGSGKSGYGITFSSFYNNSYICTPQKMLQDQYSKDFPHILTLLKGKSNYECTKFTEKKLSCEEAPCQTGVAKAEEIKKDCIAKGSCPYYNARNSLRKSPTGLLNFNNLLLLYYSTLLKKRDLLVIDEAHNIESTLFQFAELSLGERGLQRYYHLLPKLKDIDEAMEFIKSTLLPAVKKDHKELYKILKDNPHLESGTEFKFMSRLKDKLSEILNKYNAGNNFVLCEDKKGYKIKPLYVKDIASRMFDIGDKKLLMSATILNKKTFCNNLGINEDVVEFINIPSYFPIENREILYTSSIGSMARAHQDKTLPKLVKEIENLLEDHKEEKGIIHTHSYKITKYLKDNMNNERLLFQSFSSQKDSILKEHMNSNNPTVLVSPGLSEGLDLKGDLSRFQIICKVPFPSLADDVIRERMKIDKDWYSWLTALALIQSIGRSVRSEEDYATTYILDGHFPNWLKWNKKFFPKYIRESMEEL